MSLPLGTLGLQEELVNVDSDSRSDCVDLKDEYFREPGSWSLHALKARSCNRCVGTKEIIL